MTEYELADLVISQTNLLYTAGDRLSDLRNIFVTYLFGYLLAAHFMGAKLSTAQVTILNVLYLVFVGSAIMETLSAGYIGDLHETVLIEMVGNSADFIDTYNAQNAFVLMAVYISAVLASLYFMWTVRHPKE